MRIGRFASRLILFSTVYALVSCAPKVQTQVLMPARQAEATKVRKVAVLPFYSTDRSIAGTLHMEIESALASVQFEGKPYFQLVDRATIDRVLQEQRFGLSGLVDQNTAANIGRLIGASGIYTGSASSEVREETYTQERRRCLDNKCKNVQTYYVSCKRRVANYSITPRLVDVESGMVIYSRTISERAESTGCEDTSPPLSAMELRQEAKNRAIAEFLRDVAPYYVTMNIKLMDSDEGIKSPEDRRKFSSGLEFAKAGRMDRACQLWNEVYSTNSNAVSLLYNLGVCNEISGNTRTAFELYKKADSMLTRPDKTITEALQRVQKRLQDEEKLKMQMR